MASQQSQPPVLWSELPPEILGLILSYLGKHDLLNARVVSHAWNEESLKVLRKSKFTQMLRERTIKEYTDTVLITKSTEPRKFIIPFHLNFIVELGTSGLHALMTYVESLCQSFGPECISTFTLTTSDLYYTNENIRETGMIEFLTLISPGLKTLDLTRLYFKTDFLQNEIITFPNLKKLSCNTRQCESGKSGPDLSYISIIENSPKLEDLTITHPCDLEDWPLKFNQLKSLSFDTTTSNPHIILDKILASSGPPLLRELSFADNLYVSEDQNVVNNILESVSSTLKSLRIRQALYARGDGFPRFMRFPKLPHLEHLGLEYNGGKECWLDAEDLNLNAETFPSLKSIELPIGLFGVESIVESPEDDVETLETIELEYHTIEFPNLTQLVLRVGYADVDEPQFWNAQLECFQNTFSTPKKLSLVNIWGQNCVKYLLALIMKSDWSKNIQEIEMIGFEQDYLGQFLDELEFNPRIVLENCSPNLAAAMKLEFRKNMQRMGMECEEIVAAPRHTILTRANPSDSVKMRNITTIKLELIPDLLYDREALHNLSAVASIPNLLGFGKYFPQLRMIEISEFLFPHIDKSAQRNHILEFKSKFPHVNFYLT